ncbi:zinc finger BED domain-containing protein RICESLEEPER 4-like [Salvia hispanica]|uniref:zinc finger BED domain-containing protein RICESLEEPER 4-like n=1 Tax=Salvia hispanica TaxID=49212 RepID=UPI00200969BF|nr:zinc finger BED domain-containing protein RICESLEEPER 4-like [Salvia hispanica]
MEKRSEVWDHFTPFLDNNKKQRAKGVHCGKTFYGESKNGTSSLKEHLSKYNKVSTTGPRQTQLVLQSGQSSSLNNWNFEQEEVRKALAYMIIVVELPFKFVEGEGFKYFCLKSCSQFKIPSRCHKGIDIGLEIEKCLHDWGINRVFTITVDYASSNNTAFVYLKRTIRKWGESVGNCDYMHMRCIAHILNLVVQKGLKEIGPSVKKFRNVVRFIKHSPTRLGKFKECCELEKISSKSMLCLDVATRWNSTFFMLEAATTFEKAFYRYELIDSSYKNDLEAKQKDLEVDDDEEEDEDVDVDGDSVQGVQKIGGKQN